MQIVWFGAMMTVTVGVTAMLELLYNGNTLGAREPRCRHKQVIDAGDFESPPA